MIKISGLYKNFGDQSVLRGVDMEIQTGEAGVILGRSGSGKSVLLKHMAGLMQPDAGKVFIDDLDISSLNERELLKVRRQMAVMFQGAALFDSMNVGENIGFFLQREGKLSAAKIAKEVAGVLELVGLEGIQSKWPADLSGGKESIEHGVAPGLLLSCTRDRIGDSSWDSFYRFRSAPQPTAEPLDTRHRQLFLYNQSLF
jgi:phospholipid/cholesterol/gamma-HCH transport system ATP-binding protein